MGRTLLRIIVSKHRQQGEESKILFNRVRESLSQKLIVPSEPVEG